MIQERNFLNETKAKFKETKQILRQAQKNAIFEEKNIKKEIKKYSNLSENSQIK